MPTHTIEKDQILFTAYYNRMWIPSLNKDQGVDIHRAFSETRISGMVLSYQAVTAARGTYNAFVSFNKEGKEWCYLTQLAPKTNLTCNKLSLQQR